VLDEIEERNWVRKAPALGNWGDADDGRIRGSTLVGYLVLAAQKLPCTSRLARTWNPSTKFSLKRLRKSV
jgi:hypothetical protein